MKKIIFSLISMLLLVAIMCSPVFAKESKKDLNDIELYPGGMPFGAKIISNGLTVVKFSCTEGKDISSAYEAGIREGDIITKINNTEINTIDEFVNKINNCQGKELSITVIRNNKELLFSVKPKFSPDDGKYKTGIWVKDSTSGIGTVTYIDPANNSFGGLGHAICDSSTGKAIPLTRGIVMDVTINGVIKGQVGTAGELKGKFEGNRIGKILRNTECGVFGVLTQRTYDNPKELIKICPKEELKDGDAYILCTLDENGPQRYKVQISNIDLSGGKTKNFCVKVTDPVLIEKSGGIVQGMSGSPIIQNGRLVGAVTHVLINDPTSGYGIFIENMLQSTWIN